MSSETPQKPPAEQPPAQQAPPQQAPAQPQMVVNVNQSTSAGGGGGGPGGMPPKDKDWQARRARLGYTTIPYP